MSITSSFRHPLASIQLNPLFHLFSVNARFTAHGIFDGATDISVLEYLYVTVYAFFYDGSLILDKSLTEMLWIERPTTAPVCLLTRLIPVAP